MYREWNGHCHVDGNASLVPGIGENQRRKVSTKWMRDCPRVRLARLCNFGVCYTIHDWDVQSHLANAASIRIEMFRSFGNLLSFVKLKQLKASTLTQRQRFGIATVWI